MGLLRSLVNGRTWEMHIALRSQDCAKLHYAGIVNPELPADPARPTKQCALAGLRFSVVDLDVSCVLKCPERPLVIVLASGSQEGMEELFLGGSRDRE